MTGGHGCQAEELYYNLTAFTASLKADALSANQGCSRYCWGPLTEVITTQNLTTTSLTQLNKNWLLPSSFNFGQKNLGVASSSHETCNMWAPMTDFINLIMIKNKKIKKHLKHWFHFYLLFFLYKISQFACSYSSSLHFNGFKPNQILPKFEMKIPGLH